MYRNSFNSFFLFWMVLIPTVSFSQDILWARQSESLSPTEGISSGKIEQDNDGNIIGLYKLSGRAMLEGELIESNGSEDILLIKYNVSGNIIWRRIIGGPSWDNNLDLSIDSHNNIMVIVTMPEGGDFLGQILDKNDGMAVAAKINPFGDLIWVKQFVGGVYSSGQSITTDLNDNVILAVRSAQFELHILKYDRNGLFIWQTSIIQSGCCTSPWIKDIITDTDDNILIIGDFLVGVSLNGSAINVDGLAGVFIFKLNPNGDTIWSTKVDSPGVFSTGAHGIEIDIDLSNNIYIVGYFQTVAKFGTLILNSKNETNYRTGYITKLNSLGQFEWARALHGWDVLPGSIAFNKTNSELGICVIANQWFNFSDQYISSINQNQTMVLMVDLNGNFNKALIVNFEAYPSYLADIVFSENNEFYVTSTSYQGFDIGCFSFSNGGMFIFKSGKIPDITVQEIDGFCLKDEVRITVSGTGVNEATSFNWFFGLGVSPVSNQTFDNYIDIKFSVDYQPSPFTVIPYFECYPRTEFSGLLGNQISLPDKPNIPEGDTINCIGKEYKYTTIENENVQGYEWVSTPTVLLGNSVQNSVFVSTFSREELGYLKVRAFNQCGFGEFSDSLQIYLHPVPEVPIINGPNEICSGQVSEFTATSNDALSFGWEIDKSINVTGVTQDSSKIAFIFPDDQSEFSIRAISKGICQTSVSDSANISVISKLPLLSDIQGELEVCLNETDVTYSVNAVPQQVTYRWDVPNGFSIMQNNDNVIKIKIESCAISGSLQVQIFNECFSSEAKSADIKVSTLPIKPILKIGECNKYIEYSGTDEFTWYKDAIQLSNSEDILNLIDSGSYKVEVINLCGKNESDEIILNPVFLENIFMPNVITPNDDNKNTFFVLDSSLQNSQVEIYNRWGKEVFKSGDYINNWSGEGLAEGSYYYFVKNKCLAQPLKGFIQIIR